MHMCIEHFVQNPELVTKVGGSGFLAGDTSCSVKLAAVVSGILYIIIADSSFAVLLEIYHL